MAKLPKVKVCGLTRKEDLQAVDESEATYAGFIFYKKTPRFVEGKLTPKEVKSFKNIKKTGVFVNEQEDFILDRIAQYGLDLVQLHGEEQPEFCKRLRRHIPVMKAFKVKDKEDILKAHQYNGVCDYFLFDTKGKYPGGNGELFNWDILKYYNGTTPFFLSGGLDPTKIKALKQFEHPAWLGIDINSGFEHAPGVKNTAKINQFLKDLFKN